MKKLLQISPRTRQWMQAGIMLLMGLYMFETLLTGEISNYINSRFDLLAVLAGTIFVAIGLVSVVSLLREKPAEMPDRISQYGRDYTRDHNTPVSLPVLIIIAIPLGLGIFVPSRPLGASAVGNSGITTSITSSLSTLNSQQFAAAPLERNILDWVRAFSASTNPDEFADQPADLIGFVYRDARFAENNQFMVTRFTVSCCVADAVAIGVIVETPDAAKLSQDSWVRVRGKFQVRDFNGERTPLLVADRVEPTAQPAKPYLYP